MDTQESYDAWVRKMIQRHCPDLFASVGTAEHKGVFFIQAVADDPRGQKCRVSLSTYGRELTVECAAFHSHFDQFCDDDHEQEFLNAIGWISAFQNDEIVIFTTLKGDRIVSAMTAEPSFHIVPAVGERVEVLSFSGKMDRTIE